MTKSKNNWVNQHNQAGKTLKVWYEVAWRTEHVRARWNQGVKEDLDASLSPLHLEFTQSYQKQQESNN